MNFNHQHCFTTEVIAIKKQNETKRPPTTFYNRGYDLEIYTRSQSPLIWLLIFILIYCI